MYGTEEEKGTTFFQFPIKSSSLMLTSKRTSHNFKASSHVQFAPLAPLTLSLTVFGNCNKCTTTSHRSHHHLDSVICRHSYFPARSCYSASAFMLLCTFVFLYTFVFSARLCFSASSCFSARSCVMYCVCLCVFADWV